MDKFEQQFEDLDVQAGYMENAINQTTALSTPAAEVDTLIAQVAEEHGLEVAEKLGIKAAVPKAAAVPEEQDELTARLAK
jgi:charged multivesicular body protein 1